jgi:hypothetical protein
LIAAGQIATPDVIKIDVEGAEADVLRGACVAMRHRPVVFLATHGAPVHQVCLEFLATSGYSSRALGGGPPEATDEVLAVASAESGLYEAGLYYDARSLI